jgi:plastocyanin
MRIARSGIYRRVHNNPEGSYTMRRTHFTAALFVLLAVGLLVQGCSKDSANSYGSTVTGPAPSPTPPNTVMMAGMTFSPATLTVSVGTTVTWNNDDGTAHTSTSDTGVWDTGNLAAGVSSTTKFTTAGSYPYHCAYHAGMKGTVIVQ